MVKGAEPTQAFADWAAARKLACEDDCACCAGRVSVGPAVCHVTAARLLQRFPVAVHEAEPDPHCAHCDGDGELAGPPGPCTDHGPWWCVCLAASAQLAYAERHQPRYRWLRRSA